MQINGRKIFSGKTYLSFSIIINIGDLVLNDFSLEFGKEIKNRFGVLRIGDEWMLKKLIKKIWYKKEYISRIFYNKTNTLSNTSALGLCMGSFVKQILTKSQNSLDHLEGRSRKGGSDLKLFLNFLMKNPLKKIKIFRFKKFTFGSWATPA